MRNTWLGPKQIGENESAYALCYQFGPLIFLFEKQMEGGECLQTMRNPMLKSAITVIGIIALFRLWESPYKILWWSILVLLVIDWLSSETVKMASRQTSARRFRLLRN